MLNRHTTTDWKLAFLCLLLTAFSATAMAQDAHYSQSGNSPLNLSPALTGVFDGDHRASTNFRRQWASVPVPYLQFSGSYDLRFRNKKGHFTPWAGGLLFNFDQSGDAKLSLAQLGVSGTYSAVLFPGKKDRFTAGAMLGGMQRAFQPGELRFDDQYIIENGSLDPTGEFFGNTTKSMADFSLGANLHLQKDSTRTAVDFGLGVFHLTEPRKNFFDEVDAQLQNRVSLYALSTFQAAERFDLLVSATVQLQSPHQEATLGLGGLYHFSTKKTQELALQFGLYYRPDDALIPAAGIHYQAWRVNLSYDMTTSNLRQADNRRGGPEVSLTYIFRQVPKLAYCKTCPTYM